MIRSTSETNSPEPPALAFSGRARWGTGNCRELETENSTGVVMDSKHGRFAGGATRNAGPLGGVRVIEMGTLIAAGFCTRLMADFGAQVIKIEPPGTGDPMREWGAKYKGCSLWWPIQSRGKECITLDLRQQEGQRLALKLLERCDVAVENFRPGTLERWNLSYSQMREVNPGIVLVRLSGFGQSGPYRDRAGFGSVAEAMGGLRYITGYPDRPPSRIGISMGDSLASLFGVMGAMMALYYRDALGHGTGQVVDVAIYEAVFALLESSVPEYDRLGIVRGRTGSLLPGIAPSNIYQTGDHKWLVIAANTDNTFHRLAQAMDKPELSSDARFHSHAARWEHVEELDDIISGWVAESTSEKALRLLNSAGVPAGQIYTIADIVEDPHYAAREMIIPVEDHELGGIKMPGIVPKLSETPGRVGWAGPGLGEHNKEVYEGLLNLDASEMTRLKKLGVI